MRYAIIKTGGKQYRVSEGDTIEVERLEVIAPNTVVFSEVLFYANEQKQEIGKPNVTGVEVLGKVLAQTRGEKIRVSKFKSKVRFRRATGHRQFLSKVLIEKISVKGEVEKPVKKSVKAKVAPKKKLA